MVWEWVAVVGLGDVVFGQGAVVWRGRGEDGVGAEVVRTAAAVVAAVFGQLMILFCGF